MFCVNNGRGWEGGKDLALELGRLGLLALRGRIELKRWGSLRAFWLTDTCRPAQVYMCLRTALVSLLLL